MRAVSGNPPFFQGFDVEARSQPRFAVPGRHVPAASSEIFAKRFEKSEHEKLLRCLAA
jgi:hypothetical protein